MGRRIQRNKKWNKDRVDAAFQEERDADERAIQTDLNLSFEDQKAFLDEDRKKGGGASARAAGGSANELARRRFEKEYAEHVERPASAKTLRRQRSIGQRRPPPEEKPWRQSGSRSPSREPPS